MDIRDVTLPQVLSVYSGKPGKCCCGCSGTHRYASAHKALAELKRGRPFDHYEYNDRQVARVLAILKAHHADVRMESSELGNYAALELDGRLYIAYFVDASLPEGAYISVLIPWEPDPKLQTPWHPTTPIGSFKTLSRGRFTSWEEARTWVKRNLFPANTYSFELHGVS